MRPFIIGIGGAHSKVGKTTIVCQILKRLSGWGAIKYTKTSFYSAIIDSPEVLRQPNKDTKRFIDAGAIDVLWVQSPPKGLIEVVEIAIDKLSHLKGIILEGNSAIETLRPDIVMFVSGDGVLKKGSERILKMADAVIFERVPPKEIPKAARRLCIDNERNYTNLINGLMNVIKKKKDSRAKSFD